MSDSYVLLAGGGDPPPPPPVAAKGSKGLRLASLDVFRGLSITLMIFVDYGGSFLPIISHSPWNGLRLADFVMPFFLFIAGVSLSLVYKRTSNKIQASQKAFLRAIKLSMLGIFLQGYFHGLNNLSFGVDLEKVRWFGVLQRIAIGYIIAALCEIWLSSMGANVDPRSGILKKYSLHWVAALFLTFVYLGLLYGLYVPDWQFKVQKSMNSSIDVDYVLKTVECGVRGDLGPACNSAGMIDRTVLGIEHLYTKPVYRNLKECTTSKNVQVHDMLPSWCQDPFDPEGILGSLMAAVTCIIGLQYGHILVCFEDHKDRLVQWLQLSILVLVIGLLLTFTGIPVNKSLYTTSYMLLTTASAGLTFSTLYLLVDVFGQRCLTFLFEFMGRHSLSIFILVPSNIAIIVIQGFYWRNPKNNIVHWIVSPLVHK